MRNRALVDLGRAARTPGSNTESFEREGAGRGQRSSVVETAALDEQLRVCPFGGRMLGDTSILVPTRHHCCPGVAPGERDTVGGGGLEWRSSKCAEGSERANGRVLVGTVSDLDAQHKTHPVEPGVQRGGRIRLEKDPGADAVVDQAHHMLESTGGVEKEGLRRLPRLQAGNRLRGERVDPGEAVGTSDGQHGTVRQIHHGGARREGALFAERVAVVLGRGANRTGLRAEAARCDVAGVG